MQFSNQKNDSQSQKVFTNLIKKNLSAKFIFTIFNCIYFLSGPLNTGWLFEINGQEQKKNREKEVQLEEKEIISEKVLFQNKTTKRARADLAADNVRLGKKLAQLIIDSSDQEEIGASQIRIKRIIGDEDSGLLGADILTIDPNVVISHINILHRILSGYVQTVFLYPKKDAALLARYILYYNALRYRDRAYIARHYQRAVTQYLADKNPGISTKYQQWAGMTALVIPLRITAVYPKSADLSRDEMKTTIEQNEQLKKQGKIREQEYKILDEKRNREHQQKIIAKDKKIKEEKEKLTDDSKKITEKKNQISEKKNERIEKLEKLRRKPGDNGNNIDQLEKEISDLGDEDQSLAQKQKEIGEKKQKIEKDLETLQDEGKKLASRQNKSPNDSLQKSSQQHGKQRQEASKAQTGGVIGPQKKGEQAPILDDGKQLLMTVYRPTEKGHFQNKLYYFDTIKNKKLKESSYQNICSRTYFIIDKVGVLVTGYDGEHDDLNSQEQHKLVLLNSKTLAKEREAKNNVYWSTPFFYKNNYIYVYTQEDDKYYFAKFSIDLRQVARTSIAVNPNSSINFVGKKEILIQNHRSRKNSNAIYIFDQQNLRLLNTIDSANK